MLPEFAGPEAFAELGGFSHLWLVFLFDRVPTGDWKPTVRPPRLGGNQRVGVYASRSPFRPNPIGLSAVKIEAVLADENAIEVSGVDLVDGTPLLDIKPYLPYCDAIGDAAPGYAGPPSSPIADFPIDYPAAIAAAIDDRGDAVEFRDLLEQTLRADPRPAYHDDPQKIYGMSLGDSEIRWRVSETAIVIESFELRASD